MAFAVCFFVVIVVFLIGYLSGVIYAKKRFDALLVLLYMESKGLPAWSATVGDSNKADEWLNEIVKKNVGVLKNGEF